MSDQRQGKRWGNVLAGITVTVVLLLSAADAAFFKAWGGVSTISTHFGYWLSTALLGIALGGMLQGLVVHFYRMLPAGTSTEQRLSVLAGMIVGGVIAWVITPQ